MWGQWHCHVYFLPGLTTCAARCCGCGAAAYRQRLDFCPCPLPTSHSWYLLRTRLSGEPAPAPPGARALVRCCTCFFLADGSCMWGQWHCHVYLHFGPTACAARCCWCGAAGSCQRLDFCPCLLPSSHSWYLLRTWLSGEPAPAPPGARALVRCCTCFFPCRRLLHVGPVALPHLPSFRPHRLRCPLPSVIWLLALLLSPSLLPPPLLCVPRPPSIPARRPEPQG